MLENNEKVDTGIGISDEVPANSEANIKADIIYHI